MVARARERFLTEAADTLGSVQRLTAGMELIPELLGIDGERRHLIAVVNGAVARGAGGIVDALAVIAARGGRLALERVDADESLLGVGLADPENQIMTNPDFPRAASELASLYTSLAGEKIDGVLTIDARALSSLLRVIGPVRVHRSPVALDAGQVVPFLTRDIYARYPDATERAIQLHALTEAVWQRLLNGDWSLPALADEIAPVAAEKHLLLWSSHVDVQREVEFLQIAGTARPPARGEYLALIAQNLGGNKIDHYISRHVRYEVTLSSRGTASVHALIRIRNDTPLADLPPEAARGPDGQGILREKLSLVGPAGARWEETLRLAPGDEDRSELTFDGVPATALSDGGFEYRLRVFRQASLVSALLEVVIVAPGGFRISNASDGLRVVPARATWEGPLVRDMDILVRLERASS